MAIRHLGGGSYWELVWVCTLIEGKDPMNCDLLKEAERSVSFCTLSRHLSLLLIELLCNYLLHSLHACLTLCLPKAMNFCSGGVVFTLLSCSGGNSRGLVPVGVVSWGYLCFY